MFGVEMKRVCNKEIKGEEETKWVSLVILRGKTGIISYTMGQARVSLVISWDKTGVTGDIGAHHARKAAVRLVGGNALGMCSFRFSILFCRCNVFTMLLLIRETRELSARRTCRHDPNLCFRLDRRGPTVRVSTFPPFLCGALL